MKKLLIIDDEEAIREGLRWIVDWEYYGYQDIRVAENGRKGLKEIREWQPDLVITDIRMPEIDGLRMIEQAKEAGANFQAIILSGYSDFEYARKAIQLGFVSYLLKPVDEEELMALLDKIAQQDALMNEEHLKHQLSAKLFGNDQTGLDNFEELYCFSFKGQLPKKTYTSLVERYPVVMLNNFGCNYLILLAENQALEERLSLKFPHGDSIVGIGWVSAKQSLQGLAGELRHLRKMEFLFPHQLITPEFLVREKQSVTYNDNCLLELVEAVLANTDIPVTLRSYCNNFIYDLAYEEDLKWQVSQDMSQLLKELQKHTTEDLPLSDKQLQTELFETENLSELFELLQNTLEKLSWEIARSLNNVDIITDILRFMLENYQQDMNLKSVADQFGYNSAYLGKKFKKKTGETFLGYLEKIRMDEAGALLKNSNLMVYEIAEQVGYKNVDYFYKKFKQFYQQSPNDFRSKL
ncbi:hypothetical protein RU97_GL000540 [Enterococcus canis]|uniref:AraC family transcriptional regulator n=1 Tax=Enterococcus canis TaxID=214095 RepID=A0A1L8RKM6_9ENTE|nr:response regulator [Enterococcus canis]OJG20307.1 hypothetical protein RU97_GL000540 [Enterococcus canis]